MKNRCKLFLCLLFCLNISFAQQKIIDSLELQLIKPTNGNTRFTNLVDLGNQYAYIDPEKGLIKLEEAFKLALKDKDSSKLATVYSEKALNYKQLGKDSIAHLLYDKAITVYKSLKNNRNTAINLFNKSLIFIARANYKPVTKLHEEALDLYLIEKDTMQMGYTMGSLAYVYAELGNYTKAMDYYLKGLSLLEQINQQESLQYASTQTNMATLYQRLKKYDEAIELHNKSLKIYKKFNHQYFIGLSYLNKGSVLYEQKKLEESLSSFKNSLSIAKNIKDLANATHCYGNIGLIYYELKRNKEALKYIDSAIIKNKKLNNFQLLSGNFNNKGNIYADRNDLKTANKYYKTALSYANKTNDKRIIKLIKRSLAEVNVKLGNYKVAYKNLEESRILNDSLLTDDKKEEIAVLKAQYDFDKEKETINANFEKEQILQKAKLDRQVLIKNVSIVSGLFLVLLLILGFVLWRKKQEAEYNAQLNALQLKSLKAQMNPHFIFNTLNSINDYVLKNEKKIASNYLAKFSNIMRKVLENTEEANVTLIEEIGFLKDYVALEQQRLQHNFEFNIVVDKNLDANATLLPPTLLQPFIENSIWHGLSPIENGVLLLTFKRDDQNLICIVEDNGKGLNEGKLENPLRKSFGLENVKTRLELLNKTTKSSAKFKISNKENSGVKVVVTLPLLVENFKKND